MSTTTNSERPSAIETLLEARRLLDAFTDRIQCGDTVAEMHTEAAHRAFATEAVAHLALEGGNGDDDGNGEYVATGYDAVGNEIEDCCFSAPGPAFSAKEVPDTFRPHHSRPGPGQGHASNTALVIDTAKVYAHDFERDARTTQQALVTSQLQAMFARGDAAGHIVDRDYLAEAIYAEAQAYEAMVSPDDTAAAVEEIMSDPRLDAAFARALDDLHLLAAEQVERQSRAQN